LREDLPQVVLEVSPPVAEQVRGRRGNREHPGHEVIGGPLEDPAIGHGHRDSGQEAGLPEDAVLAVGRGVADALAGPPVAAQVLAP
jgi:hypothetical protein